MGSIRKSDMLDGDIILYHGNGLISKAIRLFDGTEVNHAGLFLGKNDMVAEALPKGLTQRSFSKSINDGNDYVLIRRLKSYPKTMRPVLKTADHYVRIGNRYAYEQIVLLAFLGLMRQLPVNKWLSWLLRKVLDEAADILMKHGTRQPMICSEFVYRCYNEASTSADSPYKLDVNPFPVGAIASFALRRGVKGRLPYAGMHKDSLLAWASSVTAGKKGAPVKFVASLQSMRPPQGFAKEQLAALGLDELIKNYLEETKKLPLKLLVKETTLQSAEMLSSINKFAQVYHHVSTVPTKKAIKVTKLSIAESTESEAAIAVEHVRDTVEDFVTPGDLYRCHTLYEVGRIP